MLSVHLQRRFSLVIAAGEAPSASPDDILATLYGTDEVSVDIRAQTVTLPEVGTVSCPGLSEFAGIEWYATIADRQSGEMSFVIGRGDPYEPERLPSGELSSPLPLKNGHVMAIPYSVVRGFAPQTRAERREMERAMAKSTRRG